MAEKDPQFDCVAGVLANSGRNVLDIMGQIKSLEIECASWAFSDSGTRFATFLEPGAAQNLEQRVDDMLTVHKYTDVAKVMAMHIPWDRLDDYSALRQKANSAGVRIGAINPNTFQEDQYKLGSVAHHDPAVRQAAYERMMECVDVMRKTGSKEVSLWFGDGTNHPGQADMRSRKKWVEESLGRVAKALQGDERMLIEYKYFEPAFYMTDIPDWGTAYRLSLKLGERAQVLVDLGHHPKGANVPQIVAGLIDEGKLGGFHLNDSKYGDDDLTVGSIDPYQLFLILYEIVIAKQDGLAKGVGLTIDQCDNIKPKIQGLMQSIENIEVANARALCVDREALTQAQLDGDAVRAEGIMEDAFNTDVRPLLRQARIEKGIDPNPLQAYIKSGYQQKIAAERGVSKGGWSS